MSVFFTMSVFLTIVFIVILMISVELQKVFNRLPALELKRRARQGDISSDRLYKLAAHGDSTQLFLWLLVILSAGLSFTFLGVTLSFWPALIVTFAIIWLGFFWLPNSQLTDAELSFAEIIAEPLGQILAFFQPPLDRLSNFLRKRRLFSSHSGLFETSDLLDLIMTQKRQSDNRINHEALDIAARATTFSDKIVEDYMTPRKLVVTVEAGDNISPKLIDELHKSGQKLFPAVEGKPERIVGTLRLVDLLDLKKTGQARDFMMPKVFYIHEDHSLAQVLDAFYKTRHQLFIVVNSFEDFVGVITLENALEQIIGKPILTDFDDYASKDLVAKHVQRTAVSDEPQPDEVVPEVVSEPAEVVE